MGAYQLRVLSEGMGEGTQGYYSGGLNERERGRLDEGASTEKGGGGGEGKGRRKGGGREEGREPSRSSRLSLLLQEAHAPDSCLGQHLHVGDPKARGGVPPGGGVVSERAAAAIGLEEEVVPNLPPSIQET